MFIMAKLSFLSHPGGKGQKMILKKRKMWAVSGTHPKENLVGMRGERADSAEITSAFKQTLNEITSFAFWDRGSNKTMIAA